MDMPLKPNILDDITKDHWIAAPPPRTKYTDPGHDQTMLEDESGRLRLVGGILSTQNLVTGCVIAVMGSETSDGDFEVVGLVIPELAPQEKKIGVKVEPEENLRRRKVALASGLGFRGNVKEGYETELLVEWLLGELGDPEVCLFDSRKTWILGYRARTNHVPVARQRIFNSPSHPRRQLPWHTALNSPPGRRRKNEEIWL